MNVRKGSLADVEGGLPIDTLGLPEPEILGG